MGNLMLTNTHNFGYFYKCRRKGNWDILGWVPVMISGNVSCEDSKEHTKVRFSVSLSHVVTDLVPFFSTVRIEIRASAGPAVE